MGCHFYMHFLLLLAYSIHSVVALCLPPWSPPPLRPQPKQTDFFAAHVMTTKHQEELPDVRADWVRGTG